MATTSRRAKPAAERKRAPGAGPKHKIDPVTLDPLAKQRFVLQLDPDLIAWIKREAEAFDHPDDRAPGADKRFAASILRKAEIESRII